MHPVNPFITEADIAEGDTRALLELIDRLARDVAEALDYARRVQWSPSSPIRHEDGIPDNPTADTVADTARLRLRLKVIESERALRETARYLDGLRHEIGRAMAPYGGLDDHCPSALTE